MKLHELTLTELAAGLSARKFSSREIADTLLGRIEKADGKLHAFTEVYAKEARALADAADTARGRTGPSSSSTPRRASLAAESASPRTIAT